MGAYGIDVGELDFSEPKAEPDAISSQVRYIRPFGAPPGTSGEFVQAPFYPGDKMEHL